MDYQECNKEALKWQKYPQQVERHKDSKGIPQWIKRVLKASPSRLEVTKETLSWVKTIHQLPSKSQIEKLSPSEFESSRTSLRVQSTKITPSWVTRKRIFSIKSRITNEAPSWVGTDTNSLMSHKGRIFPSGSYIVKDFLVNRKLPRKAPSWVGIIK